MGGGDIFFVTTIEKLPELGRIQANNLTRIECRTCCNICAI